MHGVNATFSISSIEKSVYIHLIVPYLFRAVRIFVFTVETLPAAHFWKCLFDLCQEKSVFSAFMLNIVPLSKLGPVRRQSQGHLVDPK